MAGKKKPLDKKKKKKRIQAQPKSPSTPSASAMLGPDDTEYEQVTVELDADTAAAYQDASALLQWMNDQVSAEAAKISERGTRVLPMVVQRISLERKKRTADAGSPLAAAAHGGEEELTNVITIDTNFDFELIRQLVVSAEPQRCEPKPELMYVNVACFTEKPLPLLLPFVYKPEPANRLDRWCFINATGARALHVVESFTALQ
mmetsp:Transcript_22067/g.86786  ORF Transcript_22067/g.86786 Transcript_22067/m.86786 type:complete len:204 (-) Transcript_22067:203-814(-)